MAEGTNLEDSSTMSQNQAVVEIPDEQSNTQPDPEVDSSVSEQPNSVIRLGLNSVETSRRILAANISSSLDNRIQPFIELSRSRPAVSITEWFNRQRQNQTETAANQNSRDSHVIDIEEHVPELPAASQEPNNQSHATPSDNINNVQVVENSTPENNNDLDENSQNERTISPEARSILKTFQKYFPFIAILLIKEIYDHRSEILNLFVLIIIFDEANRELKREISKQRNRRISTLLGILSYIFGCFVVITLVLQMPLISPYPEPTTVTQLLWTVAVTDFVLKLLTISIKVWFTCLPVCFVPIQKRGKYYLLIEVASQLYRSTVPVHSWIFYLYNIYNGPAPFLGIILFCIYLVCKCSDLFSVAKSFKDTIIKIMASTNLGVTPSKDQILASGGVCAICHDEFTTPIKLHCKHIFCELCVSTWLDRERSCPLCRALITDDPIYRDGHTTYFVQLY